MAKEKESPNLEWNILHLLIKVFFFFFLSRVFKVSSYPCPFSPETSGLGPLDAFQRLGAGTSRVGEPSSSGCECVVLWAAVPEAESWLAAG